MLTPDLNIKYFHAGKASEDSDYTFGVESAIEVLLSGITRYPINKSALDSLESGYLNSLKTMCLQKSASFNPNSNKDVASRIESLRLGISIPKTAKGNVSITKDWLEDNAGKHDFLNSIREWRLANRSLQTVEQIRGCLSSDGQWISTLWRTHSAEGSCRMVAEAYPVNLLPADFRSMIATPPGLKWVNLYMPNLDISLMAHASGDPTLLVDVASPTPLQDISAKLKTSPDRARRLFDSLFYDFQSEIETALAGDLNSLQGLRDTYPVF